MKASALEFSFRYLLQAVIFGLGLFAPWNYLLHADPTGANAHLWGVLSAWLFEQHVMQIGTAFDGLLSLGILLAIVAAALRTWGTAYLGTGVTGGRRRHAGLVTAGPYRFLRNPLYLGTMLHSLALALLMPISGAVLSVTLTALLQVRLILGEEAFLTQNLGASYVAYCELVPRVIPVLRSRVTVSAQRPRWIAALLAEIYTWGVAGSFAFAGWDFNASLLIRCALISMGVALIAWALKPMASSQVASV